MYIPVLILIKHIPIYKGINQKTVVSKQMKYQNAQAAQESHSIQIQCPINITPELKSALYSICMQCTTSSFIRNVTFEKAEAEIQQCQGLLWIDRFQATPHSHLLLLQLWLAWKQTGIAPSSYNSLGAITLFFCSSNLCNNFYDAIFVLNTSLFEIPRVVTIVLTTEYFLAAHCCLTFSFIYSTNI